MKTHTRDIRDDIMEMRSRLGLTQADFAMLVGVHQATVCKWESGALAIGRWGHVALERFGQEITTRQQALRALRRLKALKRSRQEAA